MEIEELVHAAPERVTVAHGIAITRQDQTRAAAVTDHWYEQIRGLMPPNSSARLLSQGVDAELPDSDSTEVWREHVWVQTRDQSHVESLSSRGARYSTVVGETGWASTNPHGSVIGAAWPTDPGARTAERTLHPRRAVAAEALLHPWRLMHGYKLHLQGEVTIARRRGFRVRGVAAYDAELVVRTGYEAAPLVFEGADEAEFVIDAERGVMLAWAGLADGQVYDTTYFIEITFGQPIDPWRFDPVLIIDGNAKFAANSSH